MEYFGVHVVLVSYLILPPEAISDYLLDSLESAGFPINAGAITLGLSSKEAVRKLHSRHRADTAARVRLSIREDMEYVARYFTDGESVNPLAIDPYIVPVLSQTESAVFRAASLLWSVPVSQGYGRRNRFLVMDRQNASLIGIFALGDPVFNLTVRDRLIGWDARGREDRLYRIFDAFVCGAVPPYRELLGAKLMALAAISNETRAILTQKYVGKRTVIRRHVKSSVPVLVTTASALGRSSVYNRLRYGSRTLYYSVGFTRGYGHFHIPEEVFGSMVVFLMERGELPENRYGKGPNWRMRVIRRALHRLGLNPELIRHGIEREVFIAPLAHNWREVLRGEETAVDALDLPFADLGSFYVARWAFPRAARDDGFRRIRRVDTLGQIDPTWCANQKVTWSLQFPGTGTTPDVRCPPV
jgi:hypothetical protein